MPKSNNIIEEWEKEEWNGWKIVSDMLDSPDNYGIFQTSKCYKGLYDFVVAQKKKARKEQKSQDLKEFKEKLAGLKEIKVTKWREKDFEYLPNKRGIWYGGFGEAKKLFSQAIDKILKEL